MKKRRKSFFEMSEEELDAQTQGEQLEILRWATPTARLDRLRQAIKKYPDTKPYVDAAEIELQQGENPDRLEIKLLRAEKALLYEVAAPGAVAYDKLDTQRRKCAKVTDAEIVAAVEKHDGNVTRAHKELQKSHPDYQRRSLDKRFEKNPHLARVRDAARRKGR